MFVRLGKINPWLDQSLKPRSVVYLVMSHKSPAKILLTMPWRGGRYIDMLIVSNWLLDIIYTNWRFNASSSWEKVAVVDTSLENFPWGTLISCRSVYGVYPGTAATGRCGNGIFFAFHARVHRRLQAHNTNSFLKINTLSNNLVNEVHLTENKILSSTLDCISQTIPAFLHLSVVCSL